MVEIKELWGLSPLSSCYELIDIENRIREAIMSRLGVPPHVLHHGLHHGFDEQSWLECKNPGIMLNWLLEQHNCRRPPIWETKKQQDRKLVWWICLCVNGVEEKAYKTNSWWDSVAEGKTLINAVMIARAWADFDQDGKAEKRADYLRHIVGNPFRSIDEMVIPYAGNLRKVENVSRLAQAIWEGEDCSFALADQLTELDCHQFAEHFRNESNHPCGCWALDYLFGKGEP